LIGGTLAPAPRPSGPPITAYEFDYKSNEIERHMSFSRGDLPSLRTEIRIAEDACAVSQGVPVRGRRRAMVAGSVVTGPDFPPGGFRW
jgi:hypothetical protein